MPEPIANTEARSQKPIEDPSLPKKLLRLLAEKPIVTEGALERKEWQERLSGALNRKETLVVILDLVGGSKLEEEFSRRMQQVFDGINQWKNTVAQSSDLETTGGRRVELQKRKTGEDEIVFFVCPKPNSDPVKILTDLQENIKKESGVEAVYIGASENPAGTDIHTALRAADLGLKRCKQTTREGGKLSPKIALVSSGQVSLEDKIIDPKELEISKPVWPEHVIYENAVDLLRKISGPALFLSPVGMKEINAQLGMTGGDRVLAQLAEKNLQILAEKGTTNPQIFKIGTTFVVPGANFSTENLEEVSAGLPKGLTYSQAILPSSSI